MSLFSKLLAISAFLGFIACILFVLFGQITVRKLRKNAKTKDALGFEFVSGWSILNVAEALALPRKWINKLEGSPLSFLYAKASILHEHTTKFDRFLGALFFWMFAVSGSSLILLTLLHSIGILE